MFKFILEVLFNVVQYFFGDPAQSNLTQKPISSYIKFDFHGTSQKLLMSKYQTILDKSGACFGLVLDAARHHINHFGAAKDDYMQKLSKKISDPSENFAYRIAGYSKLQITGDCKINDVQKLVIVLAKQEMSASKYIGIRMASEKDAHEFGIKVSYVNGQKVYQVYDPNYGESQKFTSLDSLCKAFSKLVNKEYAWMGNKTFEITDLDRSIREDYKIKEGMDKYLMSDLCESIIARDTKNICELIEGRKELLTQHFSKFMVVEHGGVAYKIMSPLHLAGLKLGIFQLAGILSYANLDMTKEDILDMAIIIKSRATMDVDVVFDFYVSTCIKEKLNANFNNGKITEEDLNFGRAAIEWMTKEADPNYSPKVSSEDMSRFRSELKEYYDTKILPMAQPVLCHATSHDYSDYADALVASDIVT